jgi:hypothetical protein
MSARVSASRLRRFSNMKRFVLASLLACLACSVTPQPAAVTTAAPTTATPEPGEPPSSSQLPPRNAGPASAVGRYHLEGEADAVNLELYDDGNFRLGVNGCDYGSLECGRWQQRGGETVLIPRAGAPNVHWFAQSSFRAEVKELRVARTGDDLRAEGSSRHAGPFVQEWKSGGVCAVCGGGEGPTGQRACEDPIPPCAD